MVKRDRKAIPFEALPGESWRDCSGFDGYRVSDIGRVASSRINGYRMTGKWNLLRIKTDKRGYQSVRLSNGEKFIDVLVQTLVLTAFVGPRPEGMEACHFPDRDPGNNHVANLRWGTRKENMADQYLHETRILGERHHRSLLDEEEVRAIHRLYTEGWTHRQIAGRFGVSRSAVSLIVTGRNWGHLGLNSSDPKRRGRFKPGHAPHRHD